VNTITSDLIRTAPTSDLKLVALCYKVDDGDAIVAAGTKAEAGYSYPEHVPYPGSEAEFELWLNRDEHFDDCRCSVCGHSLIYNCVVLHVPTGKFYDLGRDCLSNIECLKNTSRWLDLNSDVAVKRVAAAKKAAISRRLGDAREAEFKANCPELQAIFDWARNFDHTPNATWNKVAYNVSTIEDIAKSVRTGNLTENRRNFVIKLHTEALQKIEAFKDQIAKTQAAIDAGLKWSAGRQVIEGVVVSIKDVDSDFGTVTKCLVKLDDERKVWGTFPKISVAIGGAFFYPTKSDRIRFTATVEPSDKDPLFAFYKRPAKVTVTEWHSVDPALLASAAEFEEVA